MIRTTKLHEPEENVPLLPDSTIQLGDKVRIKNPSREQLSEGIVIRTTKHYMWVETGEGPPIKRKQKNLEKVHLSKENKKI